VELRGLEPLTPTLPGVKLRPRAEQLGADFMALGGVDNLQPRSAYDNLLLTAHDRISPGLAS
jgi:hypothetical protein